MYVVYKLCESEEQFGCTKRPGKCVVKSISSSTESSPVGPRVSSPARTGTARWRHWRSQDF